MRFSPPISMKGRFRSRRSSSSKRKPNALPDILWTSLLALKESAEAFPPLKGAVGSVIAICDIAERTKHSQVEAIGLALRVKEILDIVADAVPDGSVISPGMMKSIYAFCRLLCEIHRHLETLSTAGKLSRLLNLNRNDALLRGFKAQLDDAYRNFMMSSTLRLEVQQTKLAFQQKQLALHQLDFAVQQSKSHVELKHVAAQTTKLLFYSRFFALFALHAIYPAFILPMK
ncbi:hypothetical protein R3P38DRAFT_1516732 [Favolaschia claudopus]|uniref:Uncharacterized protein n=1 Tax=Favolaschia claudopus TaxID=2862362 RepID=A0AAW0AJY4_9AGAR